MIAGTKFRGEFEDRLKAVVKEIIDSNGEIICFIDELHTLVGAGSAEGAIDAANLLKPALARGELRCIGATTLNEYKKHVEKDAALARRFQTVLVGEPTVDDTIAILRGLKEKFEIHHGVRIKDSAIIAAAVLSHRYIADRFLPDKAIDLIDEAGSALRLQIGSMPIEIDDLDRRISHLEIERQALEQGKRPRLARASARGRKRTGAAARRSRRPQGALEPREEPPSTRVRQLKEEQDALRQEEEKATRAGDWEKAAQLRYGRLSQIEKDIQAAEQELEAVKENALLKEEIGEDDIARIVAKWTGIPVTTHDGRRSAEAGPHAGAPEGPRGRPGRSRAPGLERHPAQPRRIERSQPAHRQLHFPRPHRRRQNRAGARPGRSTCSTTRRP